MDITLTPNGAPSPNGMADLIKDANTQSFPKDVMEESVNQPVLVDFWAPWCGPCKQLGPAIEKIVTQFGGKVKLVKIDIDQNQELAGQMGVKSIPAVFAFSGGKPVDGFMGALPESEIRAFVQKQIDGAGAPPDSPEAQIAEALAAAEQSLADQDYPAAEHVFQMILQYKPDHDEALIGMARVLSLTQREPEAEAILASVSTEGQASDAYKAIQAALQLAKEAEGLGDTADLEAKIAADPLNHQARFDFAIALNAAGDRLAAAENLIAIVRQDRDWEEDAARKKLLELFEAWGPTELATLKARRLLSASLFA